MPGARENCWSHLLSGTPVNDTGVSVNPASVAQVGEIAALKANVTKLEAEVGGLRALMTKLCVELGVSVL